MKLSKVDHTRFAVTAKDSDNKGILYDNPRKQRNPIRNLERQYDSLSRRAEGLYCILNPAKGKEPKELRFFRNSVNKLIKDMFDLSSDANTQEGVKERIKWLKSAHMVQYASDIKALSNEQIELTINEYIRSSLRINVFVNGERYYLPDIITEYLIGLKGCSNAEGDFCNLVDSIGVDKIKKLLCMVINDRKKPNRKVNTIRSIENQTARVKVIKKDGKSILIPSYADHPKKGHTFDFMCSYCAGSEADRIRILSRIRTLLVIYLRVERNISSVNVNEKSFCGELTNEDYLLPDLKHSFDIIHDMKLKLTDIRDEIEALTKKAKGKEENTQIVILQVQKASLEKEIRKTNADIQTSIDECLKKHFITASEILENGNFQIYESGITTDAENQPVDEWKTLTAKFKETQKAFENGAFTTYGVDLSGQSVNNGKKIPAELFLLDYFDKEARKILLQKSSKLDYYKLNLLWLGKKIWNNWISYIAQKYIDYGKAVYHFALPEEFKLNEGESHFGEVLLKYQKGISSFEYERVKARENLDRDTAVAVTFAANTFQRAVLKEMPMVMNDRTKKMEPANDILFIGSDKYKPCLYDDAGKRVLRYFGGFSNWQDNEEIAYYSEEESGIELIEPIRLQIKDLRNISFHYAANESKIDSTVIRTLFEQEEKEYSQIIRNKYYSNNVYRFYSEEGIIKLIDYLYGQPSYIPSQIPAFSRLFNRNSAYIHDKLLRGRARKKIACAGPAEVEVFKGTFLFLLKEVYYNAFLQDPACKNRFMALINGEDGRIEVKNEDALNDFRKRIEFIGENSTLGEICQQIMTDYELQNQDKKVSKSGKNDREIYKHFRTLLYLYLRETFVDYLLKSEMADVFSVIREPAVNELWKKKTQADYLSGWTCNTYKDLLKNEGMLKWYTLAHFLTPKQLNHLIGAYKSYEVYINDIDRRSSDTGNRTDSVKVEEESYRIRSIVEMLSFSLNYCARTTNTLTDYFKDDDEYASTLAEFIAISKKYTKENSTALKVFCDGEVTIEEQLANGQRARKKTRIGIYHDGRNPVINRNVLLALMYGDLHLLSATCDKVTETDVRSYYKLQTELTNVFKKGQCQSREEQEKLRDFQNYKNFIEFHDMLSFTEIVNDLNGQLVNWSYFRERDLMYLQLGVQYTKLFFTDSVSKNDFRRKISGRDVNISEGAILYQIIAMYNYGLPIFGFDKKGQGKVAVEAGVTSSGCIGGFVRSYCRETFEEPKTYNEGLFFFENIGAHDEIIETRNYIDHFKYYTDHKRSLLDLYSEVYERFFSYSVNYKKSVSFILPNVLDRYFVILRTEMTKNERMVKNGNETAPHIVPGISVTGVSSEKLTYKITENEKTREIRVLARSEKYLSNVLKILSYRAGE